MAGGRGGALVLLLILSAVAAPTATGFLDCNHAVSLVGSCTNFIMYGFPQPTLGSSCCTGVVDLRDIASTMEGRRSLCGCLVGLAAAFHPNRAAIANLPASCGVFLGFNIDINTDCNSIP